MQDQFKHTIGPQFFLALACLMAASSAAAAEQETAIYDIPGGELRLTLIEYDPLLHLDFFAPVDKEDLHRFEWVLPYRNAYRVWDPEISRNEVAEAVAPQGRDKHMRVHYEPSRESGPTDRMQHFRRQTALFEIRYIFPDREFVMVVRDVSQWRDSPPEVPDGMNLLGAIFERIDGKLRVISSTFMREAMEAHGVDDRRLLSTRIHEVREALAEGRAPE